jgi:zinc transporter ZupT
MDVDDAEWQAQHETGGFKAKIKHPCRKVVAGIVGIVVVVLALVALTGGGSDGGGDGGGGPSYSPFLGADGQQQEPADTQEPEPADDESLDAFKAVAMVSIFAVAMLGGFAPYVVVRRRQHQHGDGAAAVQRDGGGNVGCSPERVLPVLNMASAGVFLSAGLMHLLADAISNEELSNLSKDFWGDEAGSLHAIALCVAGLLFLVGIEQLGHARHAPGAPSCCGDAESGGLDKSSYEGLVSGSTRDESVSLGSPPPTAGEPDEGDSLVRDTSRPSENGSSHETASGARKAVAPASSAAVALTIGVALSVHAVMEGLALGAQEDIEQSIGIFIAILAHKGVAAFALGSKVVNYLQQAAAESPTAPRAGLSFSAAMTMFSAATPFGAGKAILFCAILYPQNDHFTKAGSGQNMRQVESKRRSLQESRSPGESRRPWLRKLRSTRGRLHSQP